MRLIKIGALLAALVLGAVFAAGLSLPEKRTSTRSAYYSSMVIHVWDSVKNMGDAASWNSMISKVETQSPTENGNKVWRFYSKDGNIMDIAIVHMEDFQQIKTRIIGGSVPFKGEWVIDLLADPNGTRVTITERAEISNPFMRVLCLIMGDPHQAMDQYLIDLGKKLGQEVVPETPTAHM